MELLLWLWLLLLLLLLLQVRDHLPEALEQRIHLLDTILLSLAKGLHQCSILSIELEELAVGDTEVGA